MCLKSFLRPELKKVVMSFLIIIVYIIMLDAFYYAGSISDKYQCKVYSLFDQEREYTKQSKTIEADAVSAEAGRVFLQLRRDLENRPVYEPIIDFVSKSQKGNWIGIIDPLDTLKKDFFSIQSYDCLKESSSKYGLDGASYLFGNQIFPVPKYVKEYNPISFNIVILNILFVAVLWYLISCLVTYTFNFRKENKKKNKR
jgi:hypothetical protein